MPRRIAQINSSRRIAGAAAVATDLWARVMTDQVMVVAFPAETIRLGRDIPRRDWRRPFYAPDLEELSASAQKLLRHVRPLARRRARRGGRRLATVRRPHELRGQPPALPAAGPTLFWQPFTDEDVVRVWNDRLSLRIADPFEQAVRTPWLPDDLGTSPGDDGGHEMTVWTHELLDALRQIGDPPLDEVDKDRKRAWRSTAYARPAADEPKEDPGRLEVPHEIRLLRTWRRSPTERGRPRWGRLIRTGPKPTITPLDPRQLEIAHSLFAAYGGRDRRVAPPGLDPQRVRRGRWCLGPGRHGRAEQQRTAAHR